MESVAKTPIENLREQLRTRFPHAEITLDRPKRASGIWYLDVTLGEHQVVTQWRSGSGFGVSSSPSLGYGEGADEIYQMEEAAYGRILSLLLSGSRTVSPAPVQLKELRKERGLSQVELANLLKKQQGEISKIERRSDVLVSTLREVVQAMNGTLKIIATFPDGDERILGLGQANHS